MRDAVIFIIIMGLLPLCFLQPHLGVMLWTWLSISNMHREVYGFAHTFSFNLVITAVTLATWIVSREPKRITVTGLTWMIGIFGAWMTFSTVDALVPAYSWPLWERHFKTLILVFVVMGLINTRVRIHSLIFAIVLALGYWGFKGGVFAILTGGNYIVFGPENSPIEDNNHLAVALCMTLPLLNYLRLHSRAPWLRVTLMGVMGLCAIAIVATYSRGGAISLLALMIAMWWHGRYKIFLAGAGVLALSVGVMMLPAAYKERIGTLNTIMEDESFKERLEVWGVAWRVAREDPWTGGGFACTEVPAVFQAYVIEPTDTVSRAVHSVYFQLLSDVGFAGLFLYLAMMLTAWLMTRAIIRETKGVERLQWANDLARMLEVSFFVFLVGGGGLSLAYYDCMFVLLAVVSNLRMYVQLNAMPLRLRQNALRHVAATGDAAPLAPSPAGPLQPVRARVLSAAERYLKRPRRGR